MSTQTVTAMFETRAEAERAADALRSAMQILPGAIHVVDQSVTTDTARTDVTEDRSFFGSIKSLFLPDEDAHSYAEGVRRGDVLVSATVEHAQATQAMDILEKHGALDYDSREQSWRVGGWQGYSAEATGAVGAATADTSATAGMNSGAATTDATTAATTSVTRPVAPATTAATMAAAGDDAGSLNLYEERMTVGKRDVSHGRVRIRAFVTETPVSEVIRLRQERVTVDRRPVDRAVTAADGDVFRERIIEATETSEEAVISKDVRVREEIGLRKDVRTEEKTITDRVRRTDVEIQNDLETRAAGTVRPIANATTTTATTNTTTPRRA